MSNLKEYLKRIEANSSKKEIVDLVTVIHGCINDSGVTINDIRSAIPTPTNKKIKRFRSWSETHAPEGVYVTIILQDNYYSIDVTGVSSSNTNATTSKRHTKILERKSPVFKIKNQIRVLYENKELQNYCKLLGGQHSQSIVQSLLKFAKD